MKKTLYDILEVSPSASEEIIKSAYKALSKKYHPDVYQGDYKEANRRMALINEAYETLSNPVKRKEYDLSILRNSELDEDEDVVTDSPFENSDSHRGNASPPQSSKSRPGCLRTILGIVFGIILIGFFIRACSNGDSKNNIKEMTGPILHDVVIELDYQEVFLTTNCPMNVYIDNVLLGRQDAGTKKEYTIALEAGEYSFYLTNDGIYKTDKLTITVGPDCRSFSFGARTRLTVGVEIWQEHTTTTQPQITVPQHTEPSATTQPSITFPSQTESPVTTQPQMTTPSQTEPLVTTQPPTTIPQQTESLVTTQPPATIPPQTEPTIAKPKNYVETLMSLPNNVDEMVVTKSGTVYYIKDNKLYSIENGKTTQLFDGKTDYYVEITVAKIVERLKEGPSDYYWAGVDTYDVGKCQDVLYFDSITLSDLGYDQNDDTVYVLGSTNVEQAPYISVYSHQIFSTTDMRNPIYSVSYGDMSATILREGHMLCERGLLVYSANRTGVLRIDPNTGIAASYGDAFNMSNDYLSVKSDLYAFGFGTMHRYDYSYAAWFSVNLEDDGIDNAMAFCVHKDQVYYVTSAGIWRLDASGTNRFKSVCVLNWTNLDFKDGIPIGEIAAFLFDDDGNIIFIDDTQCRLRKICIVE